MTEYATFNDPPEEPKKKGWRRKLNDILYGTTGLAPEEAKAKQELAGVSGLCS